MEEKITIMVHPAGKAMVLLSNIQIRALLASILNRVAHKSVCGTHVPMRDGLIHRHYFKFKVAQPSLY